MEFATTHRRTHDEIYLNQTRNESPKHAFLEAHRLLDLAFEGDWKSKNILDVGCAAGHFPHFLKSRHEDAIIEGLEFRKDLMNHGKRLFPNLTIKQGDVTQPNATRDQWHAITMLGVLSIFDEIEPVIRNMFSWLSGPGSVVLIHGMFNPHPVDTFVKYRKAADAPSSPLESGWNIISQQRLSETALRLGAKKVKFHKFELPFDLHGSKEDVLRSWSEMRPDGSRYVTNGLSLIQPQFFAEIRT